MICRESHWLKLPMKLKINRCLTPDWRAMAYRESETLTGVFIGLDGL